MVIQNKPRYKKTSQGKEAEIIKQHAWKMVDSLHNAEFLLQGFKLDRRRALMLQPNILDAFSFRYGRFSFCAKILFYIV